MQIFKWQWHNASVTLWHLGPHFHGSATTTTSSTPTGWYFHELEICVHSTQQGEETQTGGRFIQIGSTKWVELLVFWWKLGFGTLRIDVSEPHLFLVQSHSAATLGKLNTCSNTEGASFQLWRLSSCLQWLAQLFQSYETSTVMWLAESVFINDYTLQFLFHFT